MSVWVPFAALVGLAAFALAGTFIGSLIGYRSRRKRPWAHAASVAFEGLQLPTAELIESMWMTIDRLHRATEQLQRASREREQREEEPERL